MHTTTQQRQPQQFGRLARQAGYFLPVEVMLSNTGYYVGTCSDKDGPVSRESREYFKTAHEATIALVRGTWTQREAA